MLVNPNLHEYRGCGMNQDRRVNAPGDPQYQMVNAGPINVRRPIKSSGHSQSGSSFQCLILAIWKCHGGDTVPLLSNVNLGNNLQRVFI